MKIIFLDIDGVLNNYKSRSRMPGHPYVGIDLRPLKLLHLIIERTGARVVLTSTWKKYWRLDSDSPSYQQVKKYMEKKFAAANIEIFDCTGHPDTYYSGNWRGSEIQEWLQEHKDLEVTDYVVLDDVVFRDYRSNQILPHLVKTEFYGSNLIKKDVDHACEILNGHLNSEEELNHIKYRWW